MKNEASTPAKQKMKSQNQVVVEKVNLCLCITECLVAVILGDGAIWWLSPFGEKAGDWIICMC